jgi:hypothetical protein
MKREKYMNLFTGCSSDRCRDILKIMKKLVLNIVCGLVVIVLTTSYAEASGAKSDLIVSIDASNLPLKEVLNDISRQTAWTVVVDDRLIDKTISGKYKDIGLESFLKRSLKGEPLIVLYDEATKSVDIRSFGEPSKMVTIKPSLPPDMLDQNKLEALKIREKKVHEEFISNPASADPLSGMTLNEIAAARMAAEKAAKEYSSNPNSVEPLTGKTLGEVATRRMAAEKASKDYNSNPNSVDPFIGKTLGEIKALREKSQKTAETTNTTPRFAPKS